MMAEEEQAMEAEALAAIFEDHFSIVEGDSQPFVWKVEIWPEATSAEGENHVGATLQVTLPLSYPDDGLPDCEISILKGLTQDHAKALLELAKEEAENNAGVPSVFAICERLREWLVENNQKGHDDLSMHAQMLRRKAEQERKEQQKQMATQFESQKTHEEMTEAEREDLEIRRKRAEGTPVNAETFTEWKTKFEEEMRLLEAQQTQEEEESSGTGGGGKKKQKTKTGRSSDDHKKGRLTGFQQFSDKAFNLEALEAAAENAQTDPDEEEEEDEDENNDNEGGIQEELFDVDDEDLDDLDFDDEEDEDEDVDI